MVETSGIEPLTSCVQSRRFPAELSPQIGIKLMVGLSGLEPPTSRLLGVRSNQLSYRPINLNEQTSKLNTICHVIPHLLKKMFRIYP